MSYRFHSKLNTLTSPLKKHRPLEVYKRSMNIVHTPEKPKKTWDDFPFLWTLEESPQSQRNKPTNTTPQKEFSAPGCFKDATPKSNKSANEDSWLDDDIFKAHDVFLHNSPEKGTPTKSTNPPASSPLRMTFKESPGQLAKSSQFEPSSPFVPFKVSLSNMNTQTQVEQKKSLSSEFPESPELVHSHSSPVSINEMFEDVEEETIPKRFISPIKPVNIKKLKQIRGFSTSTNAQIHLQTQVPKDQMFKPLKSVKPIILSSEQEYVLKLVLKGTSLFYTGSAGTGKSVLLKEIIKTLRSRYDKGEVAVAASTGLAAFNIGGTTLHSFAGVGLAQGTPESILKKVRTNRKACSRWRGIKVLVIDEISMIDGKFFDTLDFIGRKLRRSKLPFGGIQVVVCGDFYQLPPVSKIINMDGTNKTEKEEPLFAFECEAWKSAIETTIVLKEVFRQRGDQQFIDMLNEMRAGTVSNESNLEFKRLLRPLEIDGGIEPAQLYCTRHEVENANNTRLNLLKGNTYLYKSMDSGSLPFEQRQTVLNNFLTPERLFLKKGAQVMCIKNFDESLVNGSLGQVVDFMDKDTYMHYQELLNDPDASIEDLQKNVAQTMAKEKKDSKDDNELKVEAKPDELSDSIFDFMEDVTGNEEDLSELSLAYKQNVERKKDLIKRLYNSSTKTKYPLVKFLLPDKNHRTILVEPEQWTVENEHQEILAKRVQLPLILAWSLSIHKSQGQTLPRVKVDLKRVFENGQAYVALSRAVSREGLQVLNFDRYKVKTHPKVKDFYASMKTADEVRKNGQQKLDLFINNETYM